MEEPSSESEETSEPEAPVDVSEETEQQPESPVQGQ